MRVLVAMVVLAVAAPAAAQSRVHEDAIPDLDLHEIAAIAPGHARLQWGVGGWARHQPGLSGAPSVGFSDVRWGARFSHDTGVRLRSHLRMLAPRGGRGGLMGALAGSHRVILDAGVGSTRGRMGVESQLDASVDHTGADRLAVDRISRGPIPYADTRAKARLALRKTFRSRSANGSGMIVPLEYEVGRVGYDFSDTSAPVRASTKRAFHTGLGTRFYDDHIVGGWIEMLGVSRSTTEIARRDSPMPDIRIRNTTVRVGLRDFTIYKGGEMAISAEAYYGWSWLRDLDSGRETNLLNLKYGVKMRGKRTTVGFGLARRGSHTADGGRLVQDWRLELSGSHRLERGGASARAIANWINDEERSGAEDPGTLGRYAIHTEAFVTAPQGLEVGVYNVAGWEPRFNGGSWDPWMQRAGVAVEMGGFMRLRGGR